MEPPFERVHVVGTFLRPDANRPPEPRRRIALQRGVGIIDDCHAAKSSPRQVLIAATGVYERLRLPINALRENVLVDSGRIAWESGSQVRIGSSVVLRVMFVCEPCAKLNKFRPRLMAQVGKDRGILARVIRGGTTNIGDPVKVEAGVYESLPEEWQARLCRILDRLPEGAWISYIRLAELNGVHPSYCRVFPRVLRLARYGSCAGSTHGVRRRSDGALESVLRSSRAAEQPWSGAEVFSTE
jgi:alkylated DNA nucleotide flippase Atl1